MHICIRLYKSVTACDVFSCCYVSCIVSFLACESSEMYLKISQAREDSKDGETFTEAKEEQGAPSRDSRPGGIYACKQDHPAMQVCFLYYLKETA